MQIIRLVDVPPSRWRNGGGETRVLWSDGGADGGFNRRISVATLKRPSPFSVLPGVSRSFLLLDEATVHMEIEGRSVWPEVGQPLHFSGSMSVAIRAIDGPCRALNVMTAGEWTHRISALPTTLAHDAIILLNDGIMGQMSLRRGDLILRPDALMQPESALAIGFERRAPARADENQFPVS